MSELELIAKKQITVQVPFPLMERAAKHMEKYHVTLTSMVLEGLDYIVTKGGKS